MPTLHSPLTELATPGMPATQVLAHYRSPQLTACLSVKPVCVEPIFLQPVTQPQVIVQLAGTVRMDITRQGQRRTYQTQPGSVYLNTAQQTPYELAWRGAGRELVRSIQLTLSPAILRQTAAVAGVEADHLELLAGSCLEAPLLQQLGCSVAGALQAPTPTDPLYLDSVAHMLAAELVHRHSARPLAWPAVGRTRLAPARLRQLCEYVQASLHQPITLESLAAIACLSPYHFSRVFKQSTGLSPHQYVMDQRLARAQQLLQQGHSSVGQVARAVGYHSASHFTRLFQRRFGVLPTERLP